MITYITVYTHKCFDHMEIQFISVALLVRTKELMISALDVRSPGSGV